MKTTLKTTFAILCLLCLCAPAYAWPGKVVSVTDGDTIIVQRQDGTNEKIRLFGIDCPEAAYTGRWEAQPYSRRATNYVKAIFANEKHVDVAIWEMGESYGRIVGGVITLHDGNTLQEKLLQAGLAWVDTRYCKLRYPQCRDWIELQEAARAQRRGLWRDDGAKAPWEWRE